MHEPVSSISIPYTFLPQIVCAEGFGTNKIQNMSVILPRRLLPTQTKAKSPGVGQEH